jgi:hypothetical protein
MQLSSIFLLPVRAAASTSLPFKGLDFSHVNEEQLFESWMWNTAWSVVFGEIYITPCFKNSEIGRLEKAWKLFCGWDRVVFNSAETWITCEFYHCTFQSLNLLLFLRAFWLSPVANCASHSCVVCSITSVSRVQLDLQFWWQSEDQSGLEVSEDWRDIAVNSSTAWYYYLSNFELLTPSYIQQHDL